MQEMKRTITTFRQLIFVAVTTLPSAGACMYGFIELEENHLKFENTVITLSYYWVSFFFSMIVLQAVSEWALKIIYRFENKP